SFFAASSWIETIPEVTFSNQIEQRVWVFACSDAALTVGGNAVTSDIEDAILAGSSLLPLLKQFGVFGG
ncbi:hypothetical protein, partial [Escherichia coli]|uniref:hypothetical protein n=1 Tax=Escherichia coli TaxID=562 RepID=UPI001BE48176